MTTVTVRPDGGTLGSGWSLVGAASIQAATNDNSDATYTRTTSGNGVSTVTFGTTTLPALSYVTNVVPRYRFYYFGTPGNPAVNRLFASLAGESGWVDQTLGTTTIATYSGAARATRPAGGAWTQADIDALSLSMTTSSGLNWINTAVVELYVDVTYNEAPVAAITNPTGTVTTTSAPPVTWTYTDPDGDAQERYQVKIFTAAQYGIGGFNPDTSPYTWSSGEVFSNAVTATPTPMANGTYRAYVKVADVGSSGRYGNWVFSGFVVNVTPPPTPTIVATADTALSRVKLDTTVGTYAGGTQLVTVQRSVDGGVTWAAVRGATAVPTANLGTFTVWDYEMPRGVVVSYRAQVVSIPAGFPIASGYSTTATATLTVSGWWLKDPQFPALNMLIRVGPTSFVLRRRIPQKTYEGLGAATATVVTDGAKGDEGTIDVWSMTAERWAKLDALLSSGRALLLEDALGRAWYIQVGDNSESTLIQSKPTGSETTSTRHFHTVTLPWTETSAPTGTSQGAGTPTG